MSFESSQLLELLDKPIAFHRSFLAVGAGVTGALMLSQAIYWMRWSMKRDPKGWFWKTMEEWEAETGLSRTEQETARRKLRDAGILLEKKEGIPCKLYFSIDLDALQTRMQGFRKQDEANHANRAAGFPQTIPINTPGITPEITEDLEACVPPTHKKRATRLPADWAPTPDQIAWARSERKDINPATEASKFRDYWIAKAGRDASKLDWDATWRNWVRNAKAVQKVTANSSEPEWLKGAR